jgi:hypothetical protein
MNALRAELPIDHCYPVRRWSQAVPVADYSPGGDCLRRPASPMFPNTEPAVPDAPGKNYHLAPTTSLDRVQRAIAMNRQLAEAEATRDRLIDPITERDRADHETTSA